MVIVQIGGGKTIHSGSGPLSVIVRLITQRQLGDALSHEVQMGERCSLASSKTFTLPLDDSFLKKFCGTVNAQLQKFLGKRYHDKSFTAAPDWTKDICSSEPCAKTFIS